MLEWIQVSIHSVSLLGLCFAGVEQALILLSCCSVLCGAAGRRVHVESGNKPVMNSVQRASHLVKRISHCINYLSTFPKYYNQWPVFIIVTLAHILPPLLMLRSTLLCKQLHQFQWYYCYGKMLLKKSTTHSEERWETLAICEYFQGLDFSRLTID